MDRSRFLNGRPGVKSLTLTPGGCADTEISVNGGLQRLACLRLGYWLLGTLTSWLPHLYVCMCVCLYACMLVCLYGCMAVCLYVRMVVCLYFVFCMLASLYVCILVYLYVCVCPAAVMQVVM
jgi:hypothetical protein